MWSGPRNLSTAMMRSFGSREDCAVWDEPFFAPFLLETGVDHPGRDETLASHETDPKTVAKACAGAAPDKSKYYFQKHMPHHMCADFPLDWVVGAKHFFLIREPVRVIASYVKGREKFTLDDLGFAPQRRLFDVLSEITGAPPPVIDSYDILSKPKAALGALCEAIDIPFDKAMLTWEAGRRVTDGAWSPYWYASVITSTGFSPLPQDKPIISDEYQDILTACQADYEALACLRIQV